MRLGRRSPISAPSEPPSSTVRALSSVPSTLVKSVTGALILSLDGVPAAAATASHASIPLAVARRSALCPRDQPVSGNELSRTLPLPPRSPERNRAHRIFLWRVSMEHGGSGILEQYAERGVRLPSHYKVRRAHDIHSDGLHSRLCEDQSHAGGAGAARRWLSSAGVGDADDL